MKIVGYVHTHCLRSDGTKDSFCTIKCEVKISRLWWQEKGLSYTASGYGKRIPTQWMIRFNGRWRRVYMHQISNIGTAFIGKSLREGYTVDIRHE